jgi:protein transport protein SEC31
MLIGGADSEIFVMDCNRPSEPTVFVPAPPPSNAKHSADITRVAWNTQVAHILASASQNGSTIIWDLRQKKAWTELRDPTGAATSDIAWNPDQGLHMVTASADGTMNIKINHLFPLYILILVEYIFHR